MRRTWIALLCLTALLALSPTATRAESVLYYVYVPSCQGCAKMKAVLETLDAPDLAIHEVNMFTDLGTAQALFDRHGVPEESRVAPMVFLRDRYVADPDVAARDLPGWIASGEAAGTVPVDLNAGQEAEPLSLLGAVLAGLVAGFNPCALSMLLFFLALLMPLERRAGRYALTFLSAKLTTYLLIGVLLAGVLSRWNPSWLPLGAKVLLTVLGLFVASLNLIDARRAQQERYGDIKNQLPRRTRGFLHGTMKRMLASPQPLLWLTVAGLGVIVAASEFMCSGQLYLATLTAGLQRGVHYGGLLLQLVVFCTMFLLPSAVITLLVLRGKQSMEVSGWMLEKMPLIKLATALVMISIILIAWLL